METTIKNYNDNNKVIVGSCHCKKIQYEGILEETNILNVMTYKCNCTICAKYRFWEIRVDPSKFTITKGKDTHDLKEYKLKPYHTIHYFCNECGTHPFGLSHINQMNKPFYFVNVPTIDNITSSQMSLLKCTYLDGFNDKFDNVPEFTNYL